MRLRHSLYAAFAAVSLVASVATAAPVGPWALAPGEYYTELRGGFLSTATRYDDNGDRMPTSGLYESRSLSSYTELGWKKSLSIQMSLPAISRTIRNSAAHDAVSNSGFGDFGLGLRWSFSNGPGATALQFAWKAPAGYNEELSPALGDGNQALSAALALGRPMGKNGFWQASGGYTYDYATIGGRSTDAADEAPKRNWSDHVNVDAALGLWMGNLLVSGQYLADLPMSTGRAYETTTMLAGPRFAYRVDDRIDAFAGSWHSPTGKNVLHVDEYYAGISWRSTKLNRLQGFLGGLKRP